MNENSTNNNNQPNVVPFKRGTNIGTGNNDGVTFADVDPKTVLNGALEAVDERGLADVIVIGVMHPNTTDETIYLAFGSSSKSWCNMLLDYAKHDCLFGED